MLPATKITPQVSGNGAAAPAVLNAFPRERFNVLAPMSLETISPYHSMRTVQVELSPNPRDGHVYKVGSEHIGGQWVDRLALSKVALLELGDAAGVRWFPPECKRMDRMDNPLYVSWQVVGAIRRPDGSWFTIKATKEIDLEIIREEIKAEQTKKAGKYEDAPKKDPAALQAYIEAKTQAEWIQRRKHKVALCETGAYNRALRMLLKLKSTYTAEEIGRPFIVTQVALNPASDPAVAAAMRVRVAKDMYDLGYEDHAPTAPALAEAEERLALIEGKAEPEDMPPGEVVTMDTSDDDDAEADLASDATDAPEPTTAEEADEVRLASKRQEVLDSLRELAPAKWKAGWKGMLAWWASFMPDTPETADLATLERAYTQLTQAKAR